MDRWLKAGRPALAGVCALVLAGGAPGQVYVDRSAGLETPQMEGGDTELEFGDVDGDGYVDLVSIGDHGSPFINTPQHGVMVWFGDGTGAWSVVQTGNFGYGGVALGDVNNDGLVDVGYGMHHNYSGVDLGDQLLEVALGDGTGTAWTAWDDGLASAGETWGMFATDFADIDNDGDLDVGSISFGCCNGVHVYRNEGDGSWTHAFGASGGNAQHVFVFGDVDGDGNADFASGHGSGNATVRRGDGAGGFVPADGNLAGSGAGGRRGVALGDVNADGRDDLSYVNLSGGLEVWTWGPGDVWRSLRGDLPASGDFDFTAIADMNADGYGDVVAFAPDEPAGRLVVYTGDGAGNWDLWADVDTPASCDSAAFRVSADVDHNGYLDIAFVAEEDCDIWTGGANRPRVFAESSAPAEPSIVPRWPRGGETFVAGGVRFLDWLSAVPAGSGATSVTIELSTRGVGGPWQVVADRVPDNGRYQWLVPADLPSTSEAYLRYTLHTDGGDASAVTPRALTILGTLPGDIDGDGDVDLTDLSLLLAAFGSCDGDASYEPAADLDGSGCVDLADLSVLLGNFGA